VAVVLALSILTHLGASRLLPCSTVGRTVTNDGNVVASPMPTEREKMLAGEMYDPLDPELVAARARARDLCQGLNATRDDPRDRRVT